MRLLYVLCLPSILNSNILPSAKLYIYVYHKSYILVYHQWCVWYSVRLDQKYNTNHNVPGRSNHHNGLILACQQV